LQVSCVISISAGAISLTRTFKKSALEQSPHVEIRSWMWSSPLWQIEQQASVRDKCGPNLHSSVAHGQRLD